MPADVVVTGGGIIGTTTALSLAECGIHTVLCERGHIAGEQSSRNVLDPDPVQRHLDAARSSLAAAFPEFRDLVVAQNWTGLIDAMPDTVPVIS